MQSKGLAVGLLTSLALGAMAPGCSDDSPQSPAADAFGEQDSGPVMDGEAADVSVDDSPDEDASDRVEGAETGQREDASVNDAHEDASSSADARGDHDGGHLVDGSTHDAGNLCARTGSMATCFDNCASGEVCFTQVICGPLADGGTTCSVGAGTVGDDRCHRACDSSSACSTGEECIRYPFFGCSDFNGGPSGRGICCPAGGCQ